jgi:O-antigen ligase
MYQKKENTQLFKKQKPTVGSYLVGAYLFSVPTFAYSGDLGLNFIPQALGLIVIFYASLNFFQTRRINIPYEIILYTLFVFWLTYTYFLAGEFQSIDSLFTSVKVGLITLGVTQLIKSDTDFYNAILIYGLSIPFVVYLNYETIIYLSIANKITDADRFGGTLANANVAAMYAISIVWVLSSLLFRPKTNFIFRLLFIVFIGIALFILFFSGSKKGYIGIALFVFLEVWLFVQKNKSSFLKLAITLIFGIVLIVSIVYFIYSSPFYSRLVRMIQDTDTGSTGARIYAFKAAIHLWLDNVHNFFLGIGHGNFQNHNLLGIYSHSTISEILVSSGIIGFSVYFGALGLLLKNLYVQSKLISKTIHFHSVFSCVIFILIFLTFNATAVLYSERGLWPLIGIIAAYSLIIKEQAFKNEDSLCH